MDDIIKEFLCLKHSGNYPPVDLIEKLKKRFPAQIKISQLRKGNKPPFIIFSTTVKIGTFKEFVRNDPEPFSATTKACLDACDWLMEAGKKYPSQSPNKCYSQSSIKKRSRANSVVLFTPTKLPQPQDKKLDEIIAFLKALGHEVKIQNYCFKDTVTSELIYYSAFIIRGIGEINAQSKKSESEANSIATEKLKQYYLFKFAKPDELQAKESFNDNGFYLNGENGYCNSEKDIDSTEYSLSRIESNFIIDKPILSPCDLKWIELINSFNSVYNPKNSSISIIEEMISKYPATFEITSDFILPGNYYLTTIKNENLGNFTGKDKSQPKSRFTALNSPFEQLRKLSSLFSSFKSFYPTGIDSCLTQMNAFLSMNNELITVQVWPKSQLLYQASIILGRLKHFDSVANNEEEARWNAFIEMVGYMQLYSERIKQASFEIDRFSSHGKKGGTYPGNRQGYTYQRPSGPKVPALPTSMCNKLMKLITDFTNVYDYRLSPKVVMDQVMEIDKSLFEIEKITSRDRNGDRQYETRIKFSSAIFNGVARSKDDSYDKALFAVFNRLSRMSELFVYFRKQYYPKIPIPDFKLQIVIHHEEVLKLKTRNHPIGFKTTISLVHFCDFHGVSKNSEEDAEELAFKNFIDYMLQLIARIPKTKEELEKDQKQIATLNPNDVANILDNRSDFSSDNMNGSFAGPRISSEIVNQTSESSVFATNLNVSTLLSTPYVDGKLSKLVKLIKNFNEVCTQGTTPLNVIQKLNEKDSFVKLTTEITRDSFITTVEFIDIGMFIFSSNDDRQKSEHEASKKAIEFICILKLFLARFEAVCKNPSYFASNHTDIIEDLMNSNNKDVKDVIKWTTTIVKDHEASPRYHSILQLKNLCSFDGIAGSEADAKEIVAADAVNYLYKLAPAARNPAIHSN